MKLSKNLIDKINKHGFHVCKNGDSYTFGKYSPAGQDWNIEIYADNIEDLPVRLFEQYDDFDVSYETYLWLDETGHGKNGAPYDMKDVYEDMMVCKEYIYELYKIVIEEDI